MTASRRTFGRSLPGLVLAATLVLLEAGSPSRAEAADIEVPVPNAVVYPGKDIMSSGVRSRAFRIKDDMIHLYVLEASELEGLVARRALVPDRPIPRAHLRERDVVEAGTEVTIVYEEGGLSITGMGKALRSAQAGEVIDVRNLDSGITISGRVAPDGTVRISG